MKTKLEDFIKEYVRTYPVYNHTVTTWGEPLIAYARADNPLFFELKKVISATHALPTDLLNDAKTVITYFLPFHKDISKSNVGGKLSSDQWAVAYVETNKLISELNKAVHEKLKEFHYHATLLPATHNFNQEELISDWSHRHVAYIAGLGKFGLHQLLITEKGCCGRIGSIVTNIEIQATERSEEEYCLYKHNKTCGKCVEECVNDALTINHFDRYKCYENCLKNADHYSEIGLADVCGKCISNVPCSYINPVMKLKK
ncbi:epoxyqueuosine reductase [Clostridiaceae bacterium 35-E11]